jgi:hypothetical protein
MTRGALIIVNPGDPTAENYCKGVYKDRDHYIAFLKTAFGGLWRPTEIRVLNQPDVSAVRAEVQRLGFCDYSMVVFSGHGYHSTSDDSTIVELSDDVFLDSNYLKADSPKQTLILDCCRLPDVPMQLTEELSKSLKPAVNLNDLACRLYYEERIQKCPEDITVLHACSKGQTAGDDESTGGYYSYPLLKGAELWAGETSLKDTENTYYVYSVVRAHEAAAENLKKARRRQVPSIEKARSGPYFPLGIVA